MASDAALLIAELFVDDKKAAAILNAFPGVLKKTQNEIDKVGDKSNFGKGVVSQLEEVENRAKKTSSLISGVFSPENIVKGAAFTAVAKFFSDSTRAALDAEKANRLLSASALEAGRSYNELAASNAKFAREAGLAKTEAASTTARIQQLANATGKPEDLEKLQKSFLDLGAARGISGGELENLIGTILSGQDEGLNRLGLSDPSKLQAAYAASIGKTVEQLSQQEKTQAAVNAVMEKAGLFTGANADKMETLSGKAERANAQLADLYTNVGENVTQSRLFINAVDFLSEAFDGLTISHSQAREELAKGVSPKELAEKNADTFGGRIEKTAQNATGAILGIFPYFYDAITEGFDVAGDRYRSAALGAAERNILADEQAYEKQKSADEKRAKSEEDVRREREQRKVDQENKARAEERVRNSNYRIERLIETGGSLDELRALQAGLDKKVLGEKSFTDQRDKISDYIRKEVESGKDKLKELEKAAIGAFETIAGRVGADNPFVKITNDYDKALSSLRENTKGLTADTREWLEALLSRQTEVDRFASRLDTALKAMDLRDEAERFRNPNDSAFSVQDRIEQYLARDRNNAGNRFLAGLDNGKGVKATPDVQATLATYASLDALIKSGYDPQNFSGFLAKQQSRILGDDSGSIQEKLQRQFEKIEEVRKRSLNGDGELAFEVNAQTDRKIIALTQSLDPSKLTNYQREQAASAREREARRLDQAETEAKEIEKSKVKAIEGLRTDVGKLLTIATKQGGQALVKIVNESGKKVEATETTPTQKDTENYMQENSPPYSLGFFGGRNR